MAPKLFITGSTGYIGGDALYVIANAHPEYEITALVRNSDKGAKIASVYPKVKLVYGNLDSAELLAEEAQKADVVLNFADADNPTAAETLIRGITSRHEGQGLGYLIHTSGTGTLTFADLRSKTHGEASEKVFDDWDGIGEITSLPADALHRNVDSVILDSAARHGATLRTAIVAPPAIYGTGRGPDNRRSVQVPGLARVILEQKQGIRVGAGKTYWNTVHVHDLSDVFRRLVEAAVAEKEGAGSKATWGAEGFYFAEDGELVWGKISEAITTEAHKQGFLRTDKVITPSNDEIVKMHPWGLIIWGANSRSKAIRARKLLGWEPKCESVEKTIPEVVQIEAVSLGLVPEGHAAKVAGSS